MAVIILLLMVLRAPSVHTNHNHGGSEHSSEHMYKSLESFNLDVQNFLKLHSISDNQTVKEIIEVTFTRLGLNDMPYCSNDPGQQLLSEAFKKSIFTENSTVVLNEGLINELFHRTLAVAIYTYKSGLCCPSGQIGSCLQKAEDSLKSLTVPQMLDLLKSKYNRHAFLGKSESNVLKYETESYANRFLCFDDRAIMKTVNIKGVVDLERKRKILSTVIVFYILKGYRIISIGEICPFTFIQSIYKHYGGRNDKISEHELSWMLRDLSVCQARQIDSGHGRHRRTGNTERSWSHQNTQNFIPGLGNKKAFNHGHFLRTGYMGQPKIGSRFLHQTTYQFDSDPIDKCFDARSLMDIFSEKFGALRDIPPSVFLDMCPALLQQTLLYQLHRPHTYYHKTSTLSTVPTVHVPFTSSTVNYSNADSWSGNVTTTDKITRFKGYLYGSLSVLVISLCSVVGAGCMKLSRADVKIYLMGSMLSLAVGCLVADAALHLLPDVILNGNEKDDDELFPDYLRKLCVFLGSIYAFFVLEMILSIRHDHSHVLDTDQELIKSISLQYSKEDNVISETNLTLNNQTTKPINSPVPKTINVDHDNSASSSTSSGRSPGASQLDHSIQVLESRCSNASDKISVHDAKSGVKALAWMIILGDGIHNFADGLAIGAAFALTFTKGMSISITVLCHELPHELGDFAVLVSTGMSLQKAVILNFLSSLTAFAGLYLGLVLGEQETASHWIFAVGAGMFLYVALTDLIPECKEYFKKKCTVKMFVGQNLGLLLGYAAMLLLAIYEEKVVF